MITSGLKPLTRAEVSGTENFKAALFVVERRS